MDIIVPPGKSFTHSVKEGHTVFAYIFEGEGYFDESEDRLIGVDHLVLFQDGNKVTVKSKDTQLRFLLVSGNPIQEPIAWYGPIVMNTQDEIETAFQEYREGSFIKHG